jgi:ABC-type glycerol-3-phosphate transport system substrate-binding protein
MDGPWFWDILRTEAPEMADKVGVFLIPYNGDNPDAESRYIPYGVPGYAIPAEAANPDGAWEVLKWITMDGGCTFFQMQNRADSPLVDCVDPEVRESNPHFDTFVEALNTVQVAPSPSVFSQIHVRMKEMEESVLLGNETAEEGIAAAAADVEALLTEAQ